MCPSTPGYPISREITERPHATREYTGFDWYEEFSFLLPAGTAFTDAGQFSGLPDSITVRVSASSAEIRLRMPGNAPGTIHRVRVDQVIELKAGARIVEARDPAGVGGASIFVLGQYASRHIDVRDNRPGPRRRHAEQLTAQESSKPSYDP
jgi:hypothetical protein